MSRWRGLLLLTMAVTISVALYSQAPTGRGLPRAAVADRVMVDKAGRTLTLLSRGQVLKRYPVRLGPAPSGPKSRQGDGRTPEGAYLIDYRNPHSKFHLGLHISYPNSADLRRAAAVGASPGGDIMVHGLPNGLGWLGRLQQLVDWTDGCIAVTDRDIEEIYRAVPDGTPIEIRP